MSELIPQNFGQLSTVFQNSMPANDELSSGIQSSFGLIGYRGKVWSLRYRGEETQLMRDDGDGPRGSIEVVIVKSSPSVSKIFYEQGYVEGSNAAPDCYSNNGVVPEPTSPKRQSDACATCRHNQWGSRVTPAGKAGKACADSKRLAVVPATDLTNEMFGGPLLLRVPAASLQDLAMYGQKMQQLGYPYFSVATRIKFDPAESYPKFVFSAIRPLSDEEGQLILAHREAHTTQRILAESEFVTAPAEPAQSQLESVFEQPPVQQPVQQQQQAPAQVQQPVQQTQAQAQQPAQQVTGFGVVAPVQQQAPAQVQQPVQQAQQPAQQQVQAPPPPIQPVEEPAPVQQQAPAQVQQPVQQAPAQVQQPVQQAQELLHQEAPAPSSPFEKSLDDMLDQLLPPA